MAEEPRVILSGFADEAAAQKTAVEQFTAYAALGLQYYTLRFIDVGSGIKNVMKLTVSEIQKLRHLQDEYGLNVSSIGSPIGKVKLVNVDDGTKNAYVPFKKYLAQDVKKACDLAHAFEAKLIRGFSFYHPKGSDVQEHLPQAVDQLGQIAEIYHQVNHPGMVLVFDAANILAQGFSTAEVYQQYLAMRPGLAWLHIKDYRAAPVAEKGGHIDEESLAEFVPADIGDGGHEAILRDFTKILASVERKLRRRGIPGVFLDLEPHLKGGGQFGGWSGPDGVGVAVRSLCRVLDYVGIRYHLRDFADIQADRGF
jgi:sugar phosphate isomerase/epimerase